MSGVGLNYIRPYPQTNYMEHQHALQTCKNEKSYINEVIPKYIMF
jgi:hypothetical protein